MRHQSQVLIVEDHDIVASAVEMMVKENYPNAVVRKAGNFPKGVKLLTTGPKLDLVILDMDIPGGESYGMIGTLRDKQPDVRILIFTGHEERRHALRFLTAGANGFLSKNSPMDECGLAIRMIMNNKKYVSDAVQQLITHSFFEKLDPAKDFKEKPLSPREKEVLDLLMQGKWTKEIATELKLKLTTVSTHKARIFEKMEVTNVIDLFKKLRPKDEGIS